MKQLQNRESTMPRLIFVFAVCVLLSQQAMADKHTMDESFNPLAKAKFVEIADPPQESLTLWYRKPALKWEKEALPIGNGRMAAMVFGGVDRERIQFNEETAGKAMMGEPRKVKSYQTLGDLLLDFPDAKEVAKYRRDLDLTTGITKVSYRVDGVTFTREVFASYPDQVIVVRLTADQPGKIDFSARFDRRDASYSSGPDNRIVLSGKLKLDYQAQLLPLVKGGTVKSADGKLSIEKADEVTLLLNGATSYVNARDVSGDAKARCESPLESAAAKTYQQLRADHVADYQSLFGRVKLDLGTTEAASQATSKLEKRP